MQCVILAGGLGTRIQSVTGNTPKSLLPIKNKPFLHYQLDWLKNSGVLNVVLCIGHGGDAIRASIKEGDAWGMTIHYVDEGTTRRGTGGALKLALDENALESSFFLMYGDSFLPIDFRSIWAYFSSRNEKALMTVLRNRGQWDKSNARFDGQRVTLYDKKQADAPGMDYIDYGLSILKREELRSALPATVPYDVADYFHGLSVQGQLAGYEMQKRFYEIGSLQGIQDFTQEEPWHSRI